VHHITTLHWGYSSRHAFVASRLSRRLDAYRLTSLAERCASMTFHALQHGSEPPRPDAGTTSNQQPSANYHPSQHRNPFLVSGFFVLSPMHASAGSRVSIQDAPSAILPIARRTCPLSGRQVTRISEHARHHAHTVSVALYQITLDAPPAQSRVSSCHASLECRTAVRFVAQRGTRPSACARQRRFRLET
jgi:hypothetical protein